MRVSPWIVPVMILVLTILGLLGAKLLVFPSVEVTFPGGDAPLAGRSQTSVFLVDGVKCVDTIMPVIQSLQDLPGIIRGVGYASTSRIEVTFDSGRTDCEAIRKCMDGPVFDEENGIFLFGIYRVLEIDGERVSPKMEVEE